MRSHLVPDPIQDSAARRNYEEIGDTDLPDHSKSGYPTYDFEWRRRAFTQALQPIMSNALAARSHDEPLKVLDVGCGNGALTIHAVGAGREIYGVDISEGLIKEALKRCPAMHGCVGSCYDLPFPDGTFDIVFSLGLLQTISDGSRCIHELVRVLKPKGVGLIEFLPKWSLVDVLPRAALHALKRDWQAARGLFGTLQARGRSWHGDFPVSRTSPRQVKNALLRAGAARARVISKRFLFFNSHYSTVVFSR